MGKIDIEFGSDCCQSSVSCIQEGDCGQLVCFVECENIEL